MRDIDIRTRLKETELRKYYLDPQSKVVDELGVCIGDSRIDVAVINGHFHGYEIKSDSDTLFRLAGQLKDYSRVFDYLTFVVGGKYIDHVISILPSWCGLIKATKKGSEPIQFDKLKEPELNKNVDSLAISQFLWKDECLELLKRWGIKRGISNKNKFILWEMISSHIPANELSIEVRNYLKCRIDWKSENMSFPNADY